MSAPPDYCECACYPCSMGFCHCSPPKRTEMKGPHENCDEKIQGLVAPLAAMREALLEWKVLAHFLDVPQHNADSFAKALNMGEAALKGSDEYTEQSLLELLKKMQTGNGGRRTGELKRRGLLEWRVTEAGLAALAAGK